MTADLGDALSGHFGSKGLRRFTAAELADLDLPDDARRTLTEAGLPLQVAPYFAATAGEPREPIAYGDHASLLGVPDVDADRARWCRIGSDHGAQVCVDSSGAVRALFPADEEPDMAVNADVRSFAAALLALDRHLPLLADPGEEDPVVYFRELRGQLMALDSDALVDDEAWWPRVLEQIRHALSFPAAAAFEYVDGRGRKQILSDTGTVGILHPERLVWQQLAAQGVRPDQVRRVHTELEPCVLPGNYCSLWLARTFPRAAFTHSFDYGNTAANREEGLVELMRFAAESEG